MSLTRKELERLADYLTRLADAIREVTKGLEDCKHRIEKLEGMGK